jgi:thiol-disulfide isomerase/thioredoxin
MEYSFVPENCLDMTSQSSVEELTGYQYYQAVKAPNHLTVINFYANWCIPCDQVAPYFEQLPSQYPNVRFYTINANLNDDTIIQLNSIDQLPSFHFFYKGRALCVVNCADIKQVKKKIQELSAKLGLSAGALG